MNDGSWQKKLVWQERNGARRFPPDCRGCGRQFASDRQVIFVRATGSSSDNACSAECAAKVTARN